MLDRVAAFANLGAALLNAVALGLNIGGDADTVSAVTSTACMCFSAWITTTYFRSAR